MSDEQARLHILELIEQGEISAEEGLKRLESLGEAEADRGERQQAAFVVPGGEDETYAPSLREDIHRWRWLWMAPLWAGVGVIVISALWMNAALQSNGFGFWFACAWLPLILGVMLVVLAWQSRSAPWLHLRIDQAPGEWPQRIAFSLPLPMGVTRWALGRYGDRIPGLENTSTAEILAALQESASPETPLYIEAEDEQEGQTVRIYIG